MITALSLLLLLSVVHCQVNKNALDAAALEQIFGKPPSSSAAGNTGGTPVPESPFTANVPSVNSNSGVGNEDPQCTLEDGNTGVCVPFFLCNKNNTVVTDGAGVLDIRFGEAETKPCTEYLHLCCALSNRRPTTDPIKPNPEPERLGCGWSNPKGADLRTTGETDGETKFGEFPWMVAVMKVLTVNFQKFDTYAGGGSLIHPSVVLTAAHSVFKVDALKIRAGEWDTGITDEIYPFQERDVASKEVHKDFNKGTLFYDVAVLFLVQPVDPAPHIRVACLPPPRERAAAGSRCFATGWGKDKFGDEGQYQVILKKVEVPVVEHSACQTALRRTRLGRFFRLHSSFMCAGGEKDKDVCKGDGGSPLSCPIEGQQDRFIQSGIVAWGIGCGQDGVPGVYGDVAILRSWIDEKVIGKGYDTNTYTY